MPDTLDNPVLSNDSAFAAAARVAQASARSPLEAAAAQSTQQQAAPAAAPADNAAIQHREVPPMDADALEKARAADKGQQQAKVAPADKEKAAQQQQQPDAETDPSVSDEPWKRRGNKDAQVKKTATDWDTLKQAHAAEMAKLQEELTKARTSPTSDLTKHPDYIKLKQQHDEYLEALKEVAVERDPAFKAKFEPRRDAVLNKIRQVSGAARDKIDSLLKLPAGEFRDSAIEQALEGFQPTTKATIMGQLQVLAMVDAERDGELAARKASFESSQQAAFTQQQQAAREREQHLTAALDKQIKAWSDPEEGHPLLAPRDGDEAWNRGVEKRLALARSIFSGESDPTTLAQASLKAASHDAILQMAYEATDRVAKLEAELSRYRAIEPGESLAASIMQSAPNDAAAPRAASPFDGGYVSHWQSGLEAARRADGVHK